jgi:hypothetical protein
MSCEKPSESESPSIVLFGKTLYRRPHKYDWDEYETLFSSYKGVIHNWKHPVVDGHAIHWHLIWEPSRHYDLRADGWTDSLDVAVECIEGAAVEDFLQQFSKRWRPLLQHVKDMQEFMWARGTRRPTAWDRIQA